MASNKEVYDKVTGRIIEALEKGTIPWERPWENGAGFGGAWPRNAVTGRQYNGFNVLALWFSGFSYPGWLTFNQARNAGASVAKGEKGTPVFYMTVMEVEDKANPGKKKKIFFAKQFTVFNVAQLAPSPVKDKLLAKYAPKPRTEPTHERRADIEGFVKATGAAITYGHNRACYIPSADRIEVPGLDQYKTADSYYGVLFHELGHWTGNAKRLDRGLNTCFGANAYAEEELVAELTAAFLCHRNGLEFESQSAAYIGNWLTKLKGDSSFIVKAASAAQKAADLIQPGAEEAPEEVTEELAA